MRVCDSMANNDKRLPIAKKPQTRLTDKRLNVEVIQLTAGGYLGVNAQGLHDMQDIGHLYNIRPHLD